MHAASVHPEPGSNSRIIVFNRSNGSLKSYPSCFALSFSFPKIYFSWVLYSSKNFSRFVFSHLHLLCTSLCYSIVKDQFTIACATAWLLYHSVFGLSIGFSKLFSKIFDFFLSTFSPFAAIPPLLRPWIFYHFHLVLSSVGFDKVYRFCISFLCRLYRTLGKKKPSAMPRALLWVVAGLHWANRLRSFLSKEPQKRTKKRHKRFRSLRRATWGSAPSPRDLFEKRSIKNFLREVI